MSDQENFGSEELISLDHFRMLLDVGWKFCEAQGHHILQDPLSRGRVEKNSWRACLAALPESLGHTVKQDDCGIPGLMAIGAPIMLVQNEPGHRWVYVASTPVSDAYFGKLQSASIITQPGAKDNLDPEYFLRTVERAFIRLDIAKFSQFPRNVQPLVIADIQEIARLEIERTKANGVPYEAVLHTGDGFVVAYEWKRNPGNGWLTQTAGRIAARLDKKNDDPSRVNVHFRMSITLGPVYLIKDLVGRPNYVGDAITETDRLLACMPPTLDDLVYFSDPVYRTHRDFLKDGFSRLGSGVDKHGISHRLYSLEYLDFDVGDVG